MELEPGASACTAAGCAASTRRIAFAAAKKTATPSRAPDAAGGPLVAGEDLLLYQVRWEEELRGLLQRLAGNRRRRHAVAKKGRPTCAARRRVISVG